MRYQLGEPPGVGATRKRQGFLFLPKIIDDEFRWLEYAWWLDEMKSGLMEDGSRWEAERWLPGND